MNVAKILSDIVDNLNDSDCGICWRFVMGGRKDYLNLAEIKCECDCCAILGILKTSSIAGYVGNTDFSTKRYVDWKLQLFAGFPSRLDIQYFNEVDPESSDSSKWSKYLYPIHCCLENIDTDICDAHNCCGEETSLEVRNFEKEVRLNFLDNNYDGWLINITLREWI